MTERSHLYEVVIRNSLVWMKIQASLWSTERSAGVFYGQLARQVGMPVDEYKPGSSFNPSVLADNLANWASVVDQLPDGWDRDEYRMDGEPYPWCETLSDGCDCHGSRGRLDLIYCADFGLHAESEKRARKSINAHYRYDVAWLESVIVETDKKRRDRATRLPPAPKGAVLVSPNPGLNLRHVPTERLKSARTAVDPLVSPGIYCSIHKRRHAYSNKVIQMVLSSVVSAMSQASGIGAIVREMATHWLKKYQSQDCLEQWLWGDVEIPDIVYKYIPAELVYRGAPKSLRATQLRALNDIMECNVETMGIGDHDTLGFLRLLWKKLSSHLGVEVPWHDLLVESRLHASPRLSPFIQLYLNDLVSVVSFSTDPLVPTMWAHYARNTGIVVGYSTHALKSLGYELRPVMYSEIAPVYVPLKDDTIRLDLPDREAMDRDLKAGRQRGGTPIQSTIDLATFGADWKSLSRLLLIKGVSWEYESEIRLLVDSNKARNTGYRDDNDWPIWLLDVPADAIKEIWRAPNTKDAVVERAVNVRGDRKGLLIQSFSAHGFRMQKTIGSRY